MFLALVGFHYSPGTHILNEGEAHIRHGCSPVHAPLFLHLDDDVLYHLLLILCKVKGILHQVVTFNDLACCKTKRNAGTLCVVFDQMHYAMNGPVHSSAMIVRRTEILSSRLFLVVGHVDGVLHKFVHTLVFAGGDGDYRNTQHPLHFIDLDSSAVSSDFIHHIQGKNHRNIQLHKLEGEIEVSLNICGIHNIYDASGVLLEDELPGDNLLGCIRREGIDTGKICNKSILMSPDRPALSVHSHSRKVTNMLVGTCKLVEECGLTAVLVTCKGEGYGLTLL